MTATVTRGGPAAGSTAGPGAPARPPFAYRQRYQRDIAAAAGLAAGVAVLALAMAAGCAWGLSRRLAEYR